jgi:3-deoxy-7-phosphoheptulonate synthase
MFEEILCPGEILKLLPACPYVKKNVQDSRRAIQDILSGRDARLALVVGPCSIHDKQATLQYAEKLKRLSLELKDLCHITMRAHIEKPRTSLGWKGYLYDPDLDASNNIGKGIVLSRELLLEINAMGLPVAMEFLEPLSHIYFKDLVSWGFIGARTCSSSTHRFLASSLNMPIGFKNSTDGNIDDAINGILAARSSHKFFSVDDDGKLCLRSSDGNDATHLVLRGSNAKINYDERSIEDACEKLYDKDISTKFIVDCSHGNAQKICTNQIQAFREVVRQITEGNTKIGGMMIESFLEEGNQDKNTNTTSYRKELSITDPCLGWASTENLLLSLKKTLSTKETLAQLLC